jgi:hypothetical protein
MLILLPLLLLLLPLLLLVAADLEKHFTEFESASVDDLIKHGLKALR